MTQYYAPTDGLLSKISEAAPKDSTAFPVHVFPKKMQAVGRSLNENLLFPIEYTFTSMLYAISLATGNSVEVLVKNGWTETAILWCILIGNSGVSKSHPLSKMIEPIKDKDTLELRQHDLLTQQYKKESAEYRKAKEPADTPEPVEPKEKITILSDYTFEGLIDRHIKNDRGVGIYVDELITMFRNFGRYSGGGSEQQQLLSAWSAKAVRSTRKGENTKVIDRPFINIIGCIQTAQLSELAKDGRDSDGFMSRCIFAFPDHIKKEYWNDGELDTALWNQYRAAISKLQDIPVNHDDIGRVCPDLLRFTPKAMSILKGWQRSNADTLNAECDDAIKSIYSKFESLAIRLSLVLQLAFYACGEADLTGVDEMAVNGAIELVNYFKGTSIKVQASIKALQKEQQQVTDNEAAHEALFNALPDTVFTTGEAIKIGQYIGVSESTVKRQLAGKERYSKLEHGKWGKIKNFVPQDKHKD